MPFTKPVPGAATTRTIGGPVIRPVAPPPGESYPSMLVSPSIPAKMAARSTETNVKNADSVASFERVSNVLGSEQKNEMTAQIAEKPTVQTAPPVMVFRYLAPVRTWRP